MNGFACWLREMSWLRSFEILRLSGTEDRSWADRGLRLAKRSLPGALRLRFLSLRWWGLPSFDSSGRTRRRAVV